MKNSLIFAILLFCAVPVAAQELSDYEKLGLGFCSAKGVIDKVAEDDNFYVIIFRDASPLTFKKSELSPELKNKIESLAPGRKIKITCVHQAFRDDWQKVYDRDGRVWPKLVDVLSVE